MAILSEEVRKRLMKNRKLTSTQADYNLRGRLAEEIPQAYRDLTLLAVIAKSSRDEKLLNIFYSCTAEMMAASFYLMAGDDSDIKTLGMKEMLKKAKALPSFA